jgi:hypothetical protein
MLSIPLYKDIEYFYNINSKNENDSANNIRENIILYVFNRETDELLPYINHQIFGTKWSILINSLNKKLDMILNEFEKNLHNKLYQFEIIKIGGRKNNDFTIRIYQNDKIINEIKLEFKNNCSQIDKLPEICQLYENSEFINYSSEISYYEYFYNNIIPKIREKYPLLPNITLDEYKKDVQKACTSKNRDKFPFFKKLDDLRNINVDEFDRNFVDISINEWLNLICKNKKCELDLSILSKKLKQMTSKIFLMWKYDIKNINNSGFYIEIIDNSNIENLKFDCLKGGKNGNNTIILNDNINQYHCLLRWKNHNGIQGTAWQIKLKKIEI